jgi:hypothetical protein
VIQNVGERGRFGALATAQLREGGGGAATTLSGDWFTRFGEEVTFNGFVSASHEQGTTGVGGAFFLGRQTNRLYTGMLATLATRDYAPATGFVSRSNTLELSPAIIDDWRPAWRPRALRQFRPALVSYTYHDPATLALQEGFLQGYLDVIWQNGAILYPYVERHLQRPQTAFALLPGVTIAPGRHDYWRTGVSVTSNPGARTGRAADLSVGSFFDGGLTRARLVGRISPSPRAALTATWEINRFEGIGVRDSSLVTHLFTPELRLALSPRVSATAFYQYNATTGTRALNARLSWE